MGRGGGRLSKMTTSRLFFMERAQLGPLGLLGLNPLFRVPEALDI